MAGVSPHVYNTEAETRNERKRKARGSYKLGDFSVEERTEEKRQRERLKRTEARGLYFTGDRKRAKRSETPVCR